MIYCKNGNTMHISGNNLPADSMIVSVRGDGQWSPMPCLLKQVTTVTEALADYYDQATPGDMLKSHDQFAYFSEDKRWEGGLTAMRPGEGYLFRRVAAGTTKIRFYNRQSNSASSPTRSQQHAVINTQSSTGAAGLFRNPAAATNMTMIARLDMYPPILADQSIRVYVAGELAAVAEPIMVDGEAYYFLTIQSDRVGELRFECGNRTLVPSYINGTSYIAPSYIEYVPDSHHGTLRAPVLLTPTTDNRPYKIIEDDRVVIIRNDERYDVTGKKMLDSH
jgi:hypothetical protein